MFRDQTLQLLDARVGKLADSPDALRTQFNDALDQITRVLTACGGGQRDTDGKTFHLFGESPPNAGKSGESPNTDQAHAILEVSQYNEFAGDATHQNLYSAKFNGPVLLNGLARFVVPPVGIIRIATATANWVNNPHPAIPTVAATDDVTGAAVVIRLYRTSTALDPNVRSGHKLPYVIDVNGNCVGTGGYADAKIGMVRLWSSTEVSIPFGWQLCNGANGTVDLRDRFVVGAGTTYVPGDTGGATTHGHGGATGATAPSTDSQGAHTHTGGTTGSGGDHSHTGSTGSTAPGTDTALAGINTDYAVTGLTAATAATGISVAAHVPETYVVDLGATQSVIKSTSAWNHVVTDPNHNHVLTEPAAGAGHRHTITAASHSHTVSSHLHSISSSGTHTHTGGTTSSDGAHTHTVASHTHSISTVSHLPPYYALCYIQRIAP